MKTLGIDTTTKNGGVVLGSGGVNLGIKSLDNPREYADQIIPAIENLLAQNRLRLQEIELIAVANGPGGFTGVRVGLAVAKAISQSLKIPSIGISTLEALAYRFRETTPLIAPMIDAQRGQVYAAIYRCAGDESVLRSPEVLVVPEVWLESLPERTSPLFVGTGTAPYSEEIFCYSSEAQVGPSDDCILDSLLQLANMKSSKAATATELVANYIRPSDAEVGSTARSSVTMEYED
jgi:tRNA threonylcarbamoyladenosine biosynthesis protein TsaB